MNRADRLLLSLWIELSEPSKPRDHKFTDKVRAQRGDYGQMPGSLKPRQQAQWIIDHAKATVDVFPRSCPPGSGQAMKDLEAYLKRCGFIEADGAVIPERE